MEKGSWWPYQIDLLRALSAACWGNSGIVTLLDALGRRGTRNKTVEIGFREIDKESATPFHHALPPDIDGVAEGNRLSSLLPSEMALLGDRVLEMNFYKKYLEHRLQTFDSRSHIRIKEQFKQPATATEKEGPYIVCLDTSASMRGKAGGGSQSDLLRPAAALARGGAKMLCHILLYGYRDFGFDGVEHGDE